MQKKLLTISVLVSGRKDTTEKCLDSLRSLRGRLDSELILVDTGCNEEMRQILERYTDQIIDFEWCNDFAKARNTALKQASGEWFLYLDDDEWFEDTTPVSDFLLSDQAADYDQAVYKARNYSNIQGTSYTEEWVSRMMRIEPDTRFVGKVHEYMSPARGKCKAIDAFVHHYGYVFADDSSREKHFNRNEPLLKEMIALEPDNMIWRIQLVQEYANVRKTKQLRKAAEDTLQNIIHKDQPYMNQCRGVFYHAVIMSLFIEEKYQDALNVIKSALRDIRNSRECQCSLYNYGIECAMKTGDYEAAEQYSEKYMEIYTDINQHPEQDEQQKIISESIIFVKDAVNQEVYDKNLLFWAVSMIRQDNCSNIGEWRKKQIEEYIQTLLDGNGGFLRMPEQIWEIGHARVVDVEGMLLNMDLSQWMAAVSVVLSETTPAELERIEKRIRGVQTMENIRYSYCKMRFADILVLVEDEESCGYIDLRNQFGSFASQTLDFYRKVYVPDAFEDEMEMLPEHCQTAVWLDRMLNCGDNNWEEMLRCLRECVKSYPEMGGLVKKFADLIGKEQEQAAREAQAAAAELQSMVEQVKPKIMLMLESGMSAEAYQVVQQLHQILPDNAQVEQLEVLVRSRLM